MSLHSLVDSPLRLAFLLPHPTQFEAPFFCYLAANAPDLHLTVYYWNTAERDAIPDAELGHSPGWDFSLTDGYEWHVLPRDRRDLEAVLKGEILTGGGFDAVIVNGYGAWQARLAISEAFRAGLPVLLRTDTTLLCPRWRIKEAVKRIVLRRMFHRMAGFLVTGSEARKYVLHYGAAEDCVFIFPYAIDNEAIARSCESYRADRARVHQELGIDKEATVVLAVVKFVQREGGLDLIRSHETLAAQHPELVLLMVGDGVDGASFRSYVKDRGVPRVIFPGYQPYSLLPKFYAAADVFVHPAHFEPWGVSVNEAMACGLPVIASDRVGAGCDLISAGENGFVYRSGDVSDLASTVQLFLSRKSEWPRMCARSRQLIAPWGFAAGARELGAAARKACATATQVARGNH